MARTFYTEHDLEDLARRGVTSLSVDDDTTLSDLARERAEKLGIELVRASEDSSATQTAAPRSAPKPTRLTKPDLKAQVRKSVLARLGNDVDPQLLDSIIGRVVDSLDTRGG